MSEDAVETADEPADVGDFPASSLPESHAPDFVGGGLTTWSTPSKLMDQSENFIRWVGWAVDIEDTEPVSVLPAEAAGVHARLGGT